MGHSDAALERVGGNGREGRMVGRSWLWAFALLTLPAQGLARADDSLAAKLDEVTKSAGAGYQAGHWGLLVSDAKTGKTVYERSADNLFCPAAAPELFNTTA